MRSAVLAGVWLACVGATAGENAPMPGTAPLPDSLGTNIHFTDEKPGEMKMLAEGGFRWLRMDLGWGGIERRKGVYDWTRFDRLLASGKPYGTRFLFILDYSNTLYETNRSVRTAEGRSAMARWAAAAVQRYKGKGILWEMWNEPNISGFWKPDPNAGDYVKLAKAVGEAIRKVAPDEMYIGPATSTIDLPFLEACFRGGLLEYWSAVSVHPYRQKPPETVQAEYARLRRLIDRYAPKGKRIPILSGEWGYSCAWGGMNDAKQARYLPRQWLINLANDVPLSIWYDWHDDGQDPKEPEHHFGTVLHPVHAGRDPVYDPKPSYLAAKTLTTVLKGFRFNKRLWTGREDDYVLLLARGKDTALAAWSVSAKPEPLTIPASAGTFRVVGHTGKAAPALTADGTGLTLTLSDAPVYLLPAKPNDLLRVTGAWQRAPAAVWRRSTPGDVIKLRLTNPLDRPLGISWAPAASVTVPPNGAATIPHPFALVREPKGVGIPLVLDVQGLGLARQLVTMHATDPIELTAYPPAGGKLTVEVSEPSGKPLAGSVELSDVRGLRPRQTSRPLAMPPGARTARVAFDLDGAPAKRFRLRLSVRGPGGKVERMGPVWRFARVDEFGRYTPETLAQGYQVLPDGDAKVASTQSIALGCPKAGPPMPGVQCLRLTYEMAKGWKFIRLAPRQAEVRKIAGRPSQLAFWLYGDGSGHSPRLRFRDATGQTFQPAGESIRWIGWKYISLPMDGRDAGHWGGAGDGKIHYPISWDSLLLIDKDRDRPGRGQIHLATPILLY